MYVWTCCHALQIVASSSAGSFSSMGAIGRPLTNTMTSGRRTERSATVNWFTTSQPFAAETSKSTMRTRRPRTLPADATSTSTPSTSIRWKRRFASMPSGGSGRRSAACRAADGRSPWTALPSARGCRPRSHPSPRRRGSRSPAVARSPGGATTSPLRALRTRSPRGTRRDLPDRRPRRAHPRARPAERRMRRRCTRGRWRELRLEPARCLVAVGRGVHGRPLPRSCPFPLGREPTAPICPVRRLRESPKRPHPRVA